MSALRLLPVLAGTLLLTGCGLEKPSPLVTLVSGGSSVHSEAAQYCFEGQEPTAEPGSDAACHQDEEFAAKVLRVQPGSIVGVDVSKDLSDNGWRVALAPAVDDGAAEPRTTARIVDEHYFSFGADFPDGRPVRVIVQEVGEGQEQATGSWEFILVPE